MLPAPKNPSLIDRAWNFLQSPTSCMAALVCLLGGLICAAGISSRNWRLTLLGATLMLPYLVPAALFLLHFTFTMLWLIPMMLWAWHIQPFLRKWKAK